MVETILRASRIFWTMLTFQTNPRSTNNAKSYQIKHPYWQVSVTIVSQDLEIVPRRVINHLLVRMDIIWRDNSRVYCYQQLHLMKTNESFYWQYMCEYESTESWTWFLGHLKEYLADSRQLTFMTHKKNNILNFLNLEFYGP